MEDSKSSQEKFLEDIALFDPILNPSDFENIDNDINAKKLSSDSNLTYLADNEDNSSKNISEKSPNILSVTSKASKKLTDDSEKLKSISNSQNTFFNVDSHYHESPSRVPLSTLALPELNALASSHSNVTDNIQYPLSPENSKKEKEKNFNDQSPRHSFNVYRFNNNTNISSSTDSIKSNNFNSNLASKKKKFETKKRSNRVEYNSVGGTSADCGASLRRRSFQQMKEKYNSTHSYKSGRFNITLSSHSEVSQSDNSSCEENEKKNESKKKNKKEDKAVPKDTTKNIKVKRFNISYSKNSSNDSTGSLISDYDPENTHLKHASSDKTVGDRHHTDNGGENNTKNKLIDFNNDDDDDVFYQMQQSSMPVLGRHKKKGNKDNTNNKSSKASTGNNNNNENTNQIIENNESNIVDLTFNAIDTNNNNSSKNSANQVKKQNNTINNSININVLSPPKSTPFNPPILDINMDSTSTTSSLLGKLCGRSESEAKGHTDDPNDLINIF